MAMSPAPGMVAGAVRVVEGGMWPAIPVRFPSPTLHEINIYQIILKVKVFEI
jgi:hypothetical protein